MVLQVGDAQTLKFYNTPVGGLELIKVSEADKTQRIKGVTFEIRKMDGALVDTVTTGDRGRVHVSLDAGDYYCVEVEAAEIQLIAGCSLQLTDEQLALALDGQIVDVDIAGIICGILPSLRKKSGAWTVMCSIPAPRASRSRWVTLRP